MSTMNDEEELLTILADYSNDLRDLKKRDGMLPADAAVARIKSRDQQIALESRKPLEAILDKYGTSKCDECREYLHDDDMAWCENCPKAFHESCAGYTYDGEGEYPSESAYALCKRCALPQKGVKDE